MLIGDWLFPFKHNSGQFLRPVEKQVRYNDKLWAAIIFIMLWIILGQLIKFISREYHSFVWMWMIRSSFCRWSWSAFIFSQNQKTSLDYCKISFPKFLATKSHLGMPCPKYKAKENLNEIIGSYMCELGCLSFLLCPEIFGKSEVMWTNKKICPPKFLFICKLRSANSWIPHFYFLPKCFLLHE